MRSRFGIRTLSKSALLARTRALARRSCRVEAELLVYLGEIDERRLYLEWACSSSFVFCTRELGFSEGAAYNRIAVARAGRRLPAMINALALGKVHFAGLRLLAPYLTAENHRAVLSQATGKSKREIEELVARLAPRPAMATVIRRIPEQVAPASAAGGVAGTEASGETVTDSAKAAGARHREKRASVEPMNEEMFRVHFTASRQLRDKLHEARDLLRHRIRDGAIARVFECALDALIAQTKKERFGIGREERNGSLEAKQTRSRHIPEAIKRAVFERDGGRCTFKDHRGRRCTEKGTLQFDHIDGFALTHKHDPARIRLLCAAHNLHEANKLYGHAFMQAARAAKANARSKKRATSRPRREGLVVPRPRTNGPTKLAGPAP
jgi:hypothetical protein